MRTQTRLIQALVPLFSYHGSMVQLLASAIRAEVRETASKDVLFRSNTYVSRLW
jgi:hypothetical protein